MGGQKEGSSVRILELQWKQSSEHKNGTLWEGSLVHPMLGRSNHGILPHRSCWGNPWWKPGYSRWKVMGSGEVLLEIRVASPVVKSDCLCPGMHLSSSHFIGCEVGIIREDKLVPLLQHGKLNDETHGF